MSARVVVTGLGLETPLGSDVEATWQRLLAGEVAVAAPRREGLAEHRPPTQALAELADEQVRRLTARHGPDADGDVRTLAGCAAAAGALAAAGLPAGADRHIGLVLGSGPGHHDFGRLVPHAGEATFDVAAWAAGLVRGAPSSLGLPLRPEAPAVATARRLGLTGPVHAVTTACAASNQALGLAYRMVRRGEVDAVVAGGSDSMVNPQGLVFFVLLGAAAHVDPAAPGSACRPFDRKRSGLVMGEGAGCVVLERLEHAQARGAPILAEVTGYGATLDAWRTTAPPPDGRGAAAAMRMALADQGIDPTQVDFVNAHGTGTKRNDPAEVAALRAVFGPHADALAVSSGKGALGHLLSGAAGVAFVLCVKALEHQAVPPTANLTTPDRLCDLDHVPGKGRAQRVRTALNNAFAFGGQNACLLVSRWAPSGGGSRP